MNNIHMIGTSVGQFDKYRNLGEWHFVTNNTATYALCVPTSAAARMILAQDPTFRTIPSPTNPDPLPSKTFAAEGAATTDTARSFLLKLKPTVPLFDPDF